MEIWSQILDTHVILYINTNTTQTTKTESEPYQKPLKTSMNTKQVYKSCPFSHFFSLKNADANKMSSSQINGE